MSKKLWRKLAGKCGYQPGGLNRRDVENPSRTGKRELLCLNPKVQEEMRDALNISKPINCRIKGPRSESVSKSSNT